MLARESVNNCASEPRKVASVIAKTRTTAEPRLTLSSHLPMFSDCEVLEEVDSWRSDNQCFMKQESVMEYKKYWWRIRLDLTLWSCWQRIRLFYTHRNSRAYSCTYLLPYERSEVAFKTLNTCAIYHSLPSCSICIYFFSFVDYTRAVIEYHFRYLIFYYEIILFSR